MYEKVYGQGHRQRLKQNSMCFMIINVHLHCHDLQMCFDVNWIVFVSRKPRSLSANLHPGSAGYSSHKDNIACIIFAGC